MKYTRTFRYAHTNKGASQVKLVVKNQTGNAGAVRHGLDPRVGKIPGGGQGN